MGVSRAGVIIDFAGNAAPDGALVCDGSEVSKTTYAALFAAIGTAWDTTNGAATPAAGNFRLPPQANGSGERSYMRPKGHAGESVGDSITNDNKQHNHTATTNSTGSHSHTTVWKYHNNVQGGGSLTGVKGGGSTHYSAYAGTHSHALTTAENSSGVAAKPDGFVCLRCIWT